MKHIFDNIAEMQNFIEPLNINGLKGRMLKLSSASRSTNEILLLYGHHASIERIYGIADSLAQYGAVTVPDFPGFGGMDSFHDIGMKPTIDAMADYLATFVKMRYKRKKFIICGMSLGFVIATRMLQKYPELVSQVELMVSFVGFAHKDDIVFTPARQRFYKTFASIFSYKLPAMFFYNVCLHPSLLRLVYGHMHNAKSKFSHLSTEEKKQAMDFEVILWRTNDVRTYMRMTVEMLELDNCKKQIKLPVHHVAVTKDQYFNNVVVEQHLRVIYQDFIEYSVTIPAHAPSIIAKKEEAAPFIPNKLRELLKQQMNIKKG